MTTRVHGEVDLRFTDGAMGALVMRDTGEVRGFSWLPSAAGVLISAGVDQVPVFRPLVAGDLPVGTTAGTVAAGDHNHAGVYEPVFGMPAGVAAGSVLASNGVGAAPVWSSSPTLSALTLAGAGATPSFAGAPLFVSVNQAAFGVGSILRFENNNTTAGAGIRLDLLAGDVPGNSYVYGSINVNGPNQVGGAAVSLGSGSNHDFVIFTAGGEVLRFNRANAGAGPYFFSFGGATAAFPASKREGVNWAFRLGDDSAYTGIIAGDVFANGAFKFNAEATSNWYRAGAGDIRLRVLNTDRLKADATNTALMPPNGGAYFYVTNGIGVYVNSTDLRFANGGIAQVLAASIADGVFQLTNAAGNGGVRFDLGALDGTLHVKTRASADTAGVKASKFTVTAAGFMIRSSVAWTDGAAAQVGTLTNAPAAGNPTKWIPIDDNGTTRYIPAW